MEQRSRTALVAHFSALEDPRQQAKVLYPLPEIVLLLLCATLAGADDFVEMRLWGVQNLSFLRRFLAYEHGVPSHDTLGEVIRVVDPDLFRACFTSWVEGLREDAPDIVAIDGKTSRRSHARRHALSPVLLTHLYGFELPLWSLNGFFCRHVPARLAISWASLILILRTFIGVFHFVRWYSGIAQI